MKQEPSMPSSPPDLDDFKDPASLWQQVDTILSRELSEQSYKTWLRPVRCVELSPGSCVLAVPDPYYGEWLKNHYEGMIRSAIASVTSKSPEIRYIVKPDLIPTPEPEEEKPSQPAVRPRASQVPEPKDRDFAAASLNKNYTFDDFVIGPGNRFAHAASMAVVEAPARNYNPLFIYGPVGLGKTHLMQSIAHEIRRKNPGFRVLYISSEKFTNHLISSIQKRSTQEFRNIYRSVDLLLIDDIHFLAEKEATQEEFFHTFNALYDAHKQIVVSSDRPPKDIPGLEERLVSRFGWGLVTDIQPPDFETRVAILKKKMEKETVSVPDDVAYFIASCIKSNIRELEGAMIRVVAYCSLTGVSLDMSVAREVLRDSLKEEENKITMDRIQRVTSDFFQIKVSELRSKKRTKSIAFPRQIAMYLIRLHTTHSLPEIGEFFGGRDHTTVLHAVQKIEKQLAVDNSLSRTIQDIQGLLKKGD